MGEPRPDLLSLLQRLVELTVRLVSGRIELASAQVRRGSARAARAAVGALLVTVGAIWIAAAAVDALAPLVASRALRELIVAAPFVVAGAIVLTRARAPSERRLAGAATDQADRHAHQRQHQQHMDPGAERVAAHHPEQPQHQEERAHHP
jgi:hypothetical protein